MLGRIGDDFLNAALCGSPTAGTPLMSLVCSCWHETFGFFLSSPVFRWPARRGDSRAPREPRLIFPEVGFPRVRHRRIARPPACQRMACIAGNSLHSSRGEVFCNAPSRWLTRSPSMNLEMTRLCCQHIPLFILTVHSSEKILLLHWELVVTVSQFSAWGSGCLMLGLICLS